MTGDISDPARDALEGIPDETEGVPVRRGLPSAVVTGGCGDIGRAIATRLRDDGFTVTVTDLLDQRRGDAVAAGLGPGIRYAPVDVTDRRAMSDLVASLERLDVMVANAGIGRSAPVLDLDDDEWQAHLDVNLTGSFLSAQIAARRMVADRAGGSIIFLSSWIGSVPWPEMTAYSVSKAGIEMLCKQFARELAPHGVRFNVVAPGIVRAGMARHQLETEPQYAARAARVVPLNVLQQPHQVASAVSFLASPQADYMTGAKMTVDGGASLFAFD